MSESSKQAKGKQRKVVERERSDHICGVVSEDLPAQMASELRSELRRPGIFGIGHFAFDVYRRVL